MTKLLHKNEMQPSSCTLAYGNTSVTLNLPQNTPVLKITEPPQRVTKERFLQGLADILPEVPITGPVAIVVADKTRRCGYEYGLKWLMESLHARQVTDEQVCFFIAYGTHAGQDEEHCLQAYGPSYRKYRFIHHDCTDQTLFSTIGTTRKGTPIRIRKDILSAQLIITFGAVSHHYFAGYGGGRKLLFPGLGEKEAIYHNHSLFLDRNTGQLAKACQPGNLQDNPVSDDLYEVHTKLPGYISIHGLPGSTGEIIEFFFGARYNDFLQVTTLLDRYYRTSRRGPYDLVIGSAGGYPKDINFIQLHKTIHNCARFVKDNGTLIILGECRDDIGSNTLLPYFEMGGYELAFNHLLDSYAGNGGTALALMEKTRRIRILLVTTLAADTVHQLGMEKITPADIEPLVTRIHQKQQSIAVIPNGSLLI